MGTQTSEKETERKLLERFLEKGEFFVNSNLTRQEARTTEKGPAVAEAHAKYQIALQRANLIPKKEAEEYVERKLRESYLNYGEAFSPNPSPTSQKAHTTEKGPAVKEAHARFNLWGHSAEEHAFHQTICGLEEKREDSMDDNERSKIGELIETLLDLDEKVQEKTSLNFSTKIPADIPAQFNEKRENLYSSANDALKEVLNPLFGKFIHAIQTAKSSIENLIKRVSLADRKPSLDSLHCFFSSGKGSVPDKSPTSARRNSIG
jgi:hypothetical protein